MATHSSFWTLTSRSGRRHVLRPRRIATLLLAALLAFTLLAAGLSLYSPRLFFDADERTTLALYGPRKVAQDHRAALGNTLRQRQPPTTSTLPTIRLLMRGEDFRSLDTSIMAYNFGELERRPRVDGEIELDTGELVPVRVSYRGINSWHHQPWKPSLRIRYPRDRLADGHRDHMLVAPEDPTALRNWLSLELARRLGLPHYGEHPVRLFINQRYFGIYTRTWRYDESLLIEQGLLPGPFLRLENRSGPRYAPHRARWDGPETWEVEGVEPAEGHAILERVIHAVSLPAGVERQAAIHALFERQAMADWLAILCYAAERHVGDHDHNLGFWLDTTSGHLLPILTDVGGYEIHRRRDRPITQALHPIQRAWLEDPRNLALYIERLDTLLREDASPEVIGRLLADQWQRLRPDALADTRTSDPGFRNRTYRRSVFPLARLDAEIEALRAVAVERMGWIRQRLDAVRATVVEIDDAGFEVLVEGLAGAVAQRIDGPGEETTAARTNLLPTLSLVSPDIDPRFENAYAIHRLSGRPEDYRFVHRLDGRVLEPATSTDPERTERLRHDQGLHPDLFLSASSPAEVSIGPGEVRWDGEHTFAAETAVRLHAGTTLRLGPEASVVIRGRLFVEGTAEAPVRILDTDPERPFGGIALVGAATAGSVVRHLHVEGGSTHRRYNLAFTGPFSIHDSPGALIEDSRFRANRGGDDLVHVARSRVVVRRSIFEDAPFDAVDFDLVRGLVEDSHFRRSGNDGLDLSMGAVEIHRSHFAHSGDKLLSVGEGARVRVVGSDFLDGPFGIAAKDRSRVHVEDVRFAECEVAWASYVKKWRWEEGGAGVADGVEIRDSTKADLELDKRSTLVRDGEIFRGTARLLEDENG